MNSWIWKGNTKDSAILVDLCFFFSLKSSLDWHYVSIQTDFGWVKCKLFALFNWCWYYHATTALQVYVIFFIFALEIEKLYFPCRKYCPMVFFIYLSLIGIFPFYSVSSNKQKKRKQNVLRSILAVQRNVYVKETFCWRMRRVYFKHFAISPMLSLKIYRHSICVDNRTIWSIHERMNGSWKFCSRACGCLYTYESL